MSWYHRRRRRQRRRHRWSWYSHPSHHLRPLQAVDGQWVGVAWLACTTATPIFDHAATTPMRADAVEAMLPFLTNGSPIHRDRTASRGKSQVDRRGPRRRRRCTRVPARRGDLHQWWHRGRQHAIFGTRSARRLGSVSRRRAPRRVTRGGGARRTRDWRRRSGASRYDG